MKYPSKFCLRRNNCSYYIKNRQHRKASEAFCNADAEKFGTIGADYPNLTVKEK